MRQTPTIVMTALALGALALSTYIAPQRNGAPPIVPGSPDAMLPDAVEGPKSYDSPGEAAEFFEAQRRPVDGSDYSPALLFEALDDIRARERVVSTRGAVAGPGEIESWTDLGPGNIGGRTRTLVFDPIDPDIMYSGGTSGGVWKSTDGGASWTALDDTMANLAITSIVMDPTDPDILYAATGEGFFGGTGPAGRGFGVFKTTDAGATWDLVLANPNQITAPGVQATNGCTVGCTDMVIRDDTNPDVLFAAFGSFQADGLYRSDDAGDTWIQYSVPAQQGRMSLALAPSDNDVLYICMADNGLGGETGKLVQVYRSVDGGASFTAQADPADQFAEFLLSNMYVGFGCFAYMNYSQGWYDNALAVDPTNPDVVWVGGIDLCRSDNAGVNWGRVAYYHYPRTNPAYVHADLHGVFFHPDYDGAANQTVFVSNDGGLFKSDNALGARTFDTCPMPPFDPVPGVTWQSLNNGYAVTQFYHGDVSRSSELFIGGAQDNGTSAVDSIADFNGWDPILGGDGGYVAIHPSDPDTIYAEIQFFPEIYKSVNGGLTFTKSVNGITDTDGLFIVPFAMDLNTPAVLWTGGSRPWRTTNGAADWELARPTAFVTGGQISAIAIAPTDSNRVYMGLHNGRVAVTSNALDPNPTWNVFSSLSGLVNGAWVSSVAVDPQDPDTAYITYSNYGIPHVYRTTNAGATWAPLDGAGDAAIPDIPAHWIAVRPSNPDMLYVATELGVFASEDAGANWQPTGLGIPHTIVESLVFQDDDTHVAFTHGRGAWRATLVPPPPLCAGDLDGDDDTDVLDFGLFTASFGQAVPPFTAGDLDGSGFVDVLDFSIFATDFGCPN